MQRRHSDGHVLMSVNYQSRDAFFSYHRVKIGHSAAFFVSEGRVSPRMFTISYKFMIQERLWQFGNLFGSTAVTIRQHLPVLTVISQTLWVLCGVCIRVRTKQ